MSQPHAITTDQFKQVLPPQLRKNVSDELLDEVNKITDPEFREQYRDNLISYTSVMTQGRFKLQAYVDAVRYVSYRLLGDTQIRAYSRAFPQKISDFKANGVSDKDIASYVTAYNKGKLVNLIMAQTMVPFHVLNQDMYQKALNVQADLMLHANSEKVRSEAANSILSHLKPPEAAKVELDVNVRQDSVIDQLRQSVLDLTAQQEKMIHAGVQSAKDVAHATIIQGEAEVTDVE